ncbi:glycosyltransferase [Arenicella xantha]|uniref:Glycosyl transferase family 2 n=1 Tax=Arenicella xantha TaxID=644221 RepID=A0A395JIL0_9GAMM|nr:glycosyltransferase [Arenicella xantha]RBP50616.1 glycosyl transferase family 2 [Arenicella xantha]
MPESISKAICLAIFIKPNTQISEASLLTAKPFIDRWIISGESLEAQQEGLIRNALAGVEGHFVGNAKNDYGQAKCALLREAQLSADWVLMLDANEELCVFTPRLQIPEAADIGLLDIKRGKSVTSEARLFSANAKVTFSYPVAEYPSANGDNSVQVSGCAVRSHTPSQSLLEDRVVNRFLLDSVLGKYPRSAELSLLLGKVELANGQLKPALLHFEAIRDLMASDTISWTAHYLAGVICSAQRNLVRAIYHWQAAFDLMPDRAEPLMRLAELHYTEEDYGSAARLTAEIADMDRPVSVDYYEPDIYRYTAEVLKAHAWHKLGRSEEAIACLNDLIAPQLNLSVKTDVRVALGDIEHEVALASAEKETSAQVGQTSNCQTLTTQASSPYPSPQPKLTIGMATHDDYDGVYFSVMSLVLYHRDHLNDVEILIIDNNPDSKHGEAVRGLAQRVKQIRYVAAQEYRGTAIRERVFQEAKGKYVLCMDCHVFLHTGSLGRLIDYFDANPNSPDILHGPIYYDDHNNFSTHMTADWYDGFYGRWGSNPQGGNSDNPPFEIPMQGLGLFACVKSQWPGFNLKFRGFGGEEGYIHEKFRQRGGRALCLPFLRWTHRFDRPNSPTYTNSWEDRIRNYLIGWDELGLDTSQILQHFSQTLGEVNTSANYARFLTEKQSPLWGYDTVYLYSAIPFGSEVLTGLGVQRIIQTASSKDMLTSLLRQSVKHGLPNVLVLIAKTDSKLEFETAIYNSLPNFESFQTGGDDIQIIESPKFQANLITSAGFLTAADCITEECLLSADKLHKMSTSFRELMVDV